MLIAAGKNKKGRKVLYLGLSAINMARLAADMPIVKDLGIQGVPGLSEWDVVVMGPEDTARFIGATRPEDLEEWMSNG